MYCESNSLAGENKSVMRFIAMALFVCIISVSILSGLFIVTHANHEHDHNGANGTCATCAHIYTAENILKQLSTAIAASGIVASGLFALISFLKTIVTLPVFFTLVKLKVRLNN